VAAAVCFVWMGCTLSASFELGSAVAAVVTPRFLLGGSRTATYSPNLRFVPTVDWSGSFSFVVVAFRIRFFGFGPGTAVSANVSFDPATGAFPSISNASVRKGRL
jgi:hypothetical protein